MNSKGKILVVDDENDIVLMIRDYLEMNYYIVFSVISSKEALEILKQENIDILITDICMPGMNGIELMTRVKEIQPDIQCIIITGNENVETSIEAIKLGALNYLVKPFAMNEITMAVEKGMEKLRLIREIRDKQKELEKRNEQLGQEIAERRKIEEDLLHTRERLTTILDSMSDMVIYLNKDMEVQWANRAALEAAGKDIKESSGPYGYDILNQYFTPDNGCPSVKSMKSGSIETSEINGPNGRIYQVKSHPVYGKNREISGFVEVSQDITDKKYRDEVQEILHIISEIFSTSKTLPLIYEKLIRIITSRFNYPSGFVMLYDKETDENIIAGKVDKTEKSKIIPVRMPLSETLSGIALRENMIINLTCLGEKDEYKSYILKNIGAENVIIVPMIIEEEAIGTLMLVDFKERTDNEWIIEQMKVIAYRLGNEIMRRKALELSKNTEKMLRAFTNNMPGAVFIKDSESRYIYTNTSFQQFLNIDREKWFMCKDSDIFRPEISAALIEQDKHILNTGETLIFEEALRRDDGVKRIFQIYKFPILKDKNKVSAVGGIAVDITEQKELEAKNKEHEIRYRRIFEDSPVSIWEGDFSQVCNYVNKLKSQGIEDIRIYFKKYPEKIRECLNMIKILNVNRATLKMFGTADKDELFDNIQGLMPEEIFPVFIEQLTGINKNRTAFEIECVKKNLNNEKLNLIMRWSVLDDFEDISARVLISLTDITRLKQAEKEAEIHRHQLMQADKMASLGVLVSGVAHEINNPNNFIMLNTPLLIESWNSILPVLDLYYEENGNFDIGGISYMKMRQNIPVLFSGIQDGCRRIKRIVSDLKDFARTDTSDMKQVFDINEVIQHAIPLVNNLIKKSTINFTTRLEENLPMVQGSFQRLEQVIINLIQNSCQALRQKGEAIKVSTGYKSESGEVVLCIEDEGRGISSGDLIRIMDPFYTTRRDSGGTGLGLSVSSNIIEEHGGKITACSNDGKGSCFTISLPAFGVKKPAKILLVDDDNTFRKFLADTLRSNSCYCVQEALNGVEACIMIGRDRPDLLILDLIMPEMDGVEVCRRIKGDDNLSDMKVIITTGMTNSSEVKEILKMGFSTIWEKPLEIQNILNDIEKILNS